MMIRLHIRSVGIISVLVLGFVANKGDAVVTDRYNYRDHPEYIHVAEGDNARLMPDPPSIDCETEFNDNDDEVVAYLVRVVYSCIACVWGGYVYSRRTIGSLQYCMRVHPLQLQ
jgi:hypothetical protein